MGDHKPPQSRPCRYCPTIVYGNRRVCSSEECQRNMKLDQYVAKVGHAPVQPKPVICPYCKEEFTPKPSHPNQRCCLNVDCKLALKRECYERNKDHMPSHAQARRYCACGCGRDLTYTRWHEYSPALECRKVMMQKRIELNKRPELEMKQNHKNRPCRYPGCKDKTGANYFYCHHHAQMLGNVYSEDAEGFGGGYAIEVFQ